VTDVLSVAAAVNARIIERRENGTGRVEVPILRAARRAPTGDSVVHVTRDVLEQVVANFERGRGLIVGVGPSPHRSFGERGQDQDAFVESLRIEGDVLYAVHDIVSPELFAEIVAGRWRGYSVEMLRDEMVPEGLRDQYHFEGWVLVGGVFTNRPLFDTVFKIAASAVATRSIFTPLGANEENEIMTDETKSISLAAHESKVGEINAALAIERDARTRMESSVQTLQAEVATLRASNATLTAAAQKSESDLTVASASKLRLEAQVQSLTATVRDISTQNTELEMTIKETEAKASDEKVRAFILAAIDPNHPSSKKNGAMNPATFDGWEADPTAFATTMCGSVDGFIDLFSRLRAAGGVGPIKNAAGSRQSGHDPATVQTDPDRTVTQAERDASRALAADTSYVGVRTDKEARAIFEASRKAAAK